MNKKTFATLFLCIVPFVGLPREGAPSATVERMPAKGTLLFFPAASIDLADLDVRDAQNRPVKSVEAQQGLARLFMENLFVLTVAAPPHSVRQAMDAVDSFSSLFNSLFFESAQPILKALAEALAPSKRRFVHNVHNLWITLSVGVLAGLLLAGNLCLERSVLRLNLRC